MGNRTNIEINDHLIRQARKLTRLKTKRQIVDKALELLVRTETRKVSSPTMDRYLARRLEGIAEKPRVILVDSSVWIDSFKSHSGSAGVELRRMIEEGTSCSDRDYRRGSFTRTDSRCDAH